VQVEINNCQDGLCLERISRGLIVEAMPQLVMKEKNLTYYESTEKTYETYVKFNKPIQLIKKLLIVLAIEKEGEQKHNTVSAHLQIRKNMKFLTRLIIFNTAIIKVTMSVKPLEYRRKNGDLVTNALSFN